MRRIALALIALLALVLVAPHTTAAQTTNLVRVVHASPDAPAVDVFVNGTAVASNVPFFTASSYLSLADGTYQVAISPAGKGTDYSVLVLNLEVSGGYTGTLVVLNQLEDIDAVLYDDDLSAPAPGQARVNAFHLSPDSVNVDVKPAGSSTAVFANVAYGDAAFVDVPAGTYAFDITATGDSEVAFTTPDLRFESGWIYSLYATGLSGEGGFWVQSRVDYIPGIGARGFSPFAQGKLTVR
jgi:Domain of unknown function (DUF4397)